VIRVILKVKRLLFEEAFVDVEAGATAPTAPCFHESQKALGMI
jgi:hypothetical protein